MDRQPPSDNASSPVSAIHPFIHQIVDGRRNGEHNEGMDGWMEGANNDGCRDGGMDGWMDG